MDAENHAVTVTRSWPLSRSIAAGYAAIVALTVALALVALIGLHSVSKRKDQVIDVDAGLVLDVQRLVAIRDARAAANRGYLLSGREKYLTEQYRNDGLFGDQVNAIRQLADTARAQQLLGQVEDLQRNFIQLDATPVRLRQEGASTAEVSAAWEAIEPQRQATNDAVNALMVYQQSLVEQRKQEASSAASHDTRVIVALLGLVVLGAVVLAVVQTRRLRRRVGGLVGDVQNSSADLKATADEQVGGAGQQATTVNEISTTTTELLASSRQIASSAERVAHTAEETADAGTAGHETVERARSSMDEIRGQVDTIVGHMRELGDRAQQIGAVLDIVTELAEQTNILAINSTIEAAGAGEAGRRFGVVADEIRKLADRVTGSAHEVRDLVELVRGSVHRTVMAMEIGSKAVDAGTAEFAEVAASFDRIVALVQTTTEAAREIELSTKQQTTAVEQVNFAVANVTETTKETESNSTQTLRNASQLTELSASLRRLIDPVTT